MGARIAALVLRLVSNEKTRNALIAIGAGLIALVLLFLQLFLAVALAASFEDDSESGNPTSGFVGGGGRPDDGHFYFPLEHVRHVNSHFDPFRVHPIYGTVQAHNGTDFGAAEATPIHATRGGTISVNGYNEWNGNYIEIDHGEGIESVYKHMYIPSPLTVGTKVDQLEIIGGVGTTGDSNGNHLHFEIRVDGVYVDAFPLLEEWPSGNEAEKKADSKNSGATAAAFSFLPPEERSSAVLFPATHETYSASA